jgi:hypothetical protein
MVPLAAIATVTEKAAIAAGPAQTAQKAVCKKFTRQLGEFES